MLELTLHPKQLAALESPATEILYGGAAGSGKSHLFRAASIAWCVAIPGLQVYFFRRMYPELLSNHMSGPSSFPVLLAPFIDRGLAKINWGNLDIEFANGSTIHLRHCQYPKDVYKYQGAEMHVLIIDELTQWMRDMYLFLRSRVRMVGIVVPTALAGLFPRALLGANPGGIGHNWVKADFVTLAKPLELVRMPAVEGGMLRQYIPARMDDNPSLMLEDPSYEAKLEGLGDPALVRAMRSGDWNIVAGGMFDDVWDPDVHVIEPFPIPISWRIDRSFDWGSSKPFSVGWWAESDGTHLANNRQFPRGTLFRIAEWYGWTGKPNEGTKALAVDIAKGILERERELRGTIVSGRTRLIERGPADTSIFSTENGVSIAKDMEGQGVEWTEADKSPGSRKNGWEKIRSMLKAAKERRPEEAGLYVFDTCVDGFIRTVPSLPRDPRNRDDVDTDAEDHTGDESRYRVLAKKPGVFGQSTWSFGEPGTQSRRTANARVYR